jgi:hypothetical protein|tara:strand:- start:2354 stop:2569 length:216 start_codon:yes stop_codon:yes gene_type:complete
MIAYILLGIFTLLLIIGQIKNADITIGPIIGFMVGFLYSHQEFDDGTYDTTLQCALGFITLSVVWTRNIKE